MLCAKPAHNSALCQPFDRPIFYSCGRSRRKQYYDRVYITYLYVYGIVVQGYEFCSLGEQVSIVITRLGGYPRWADESDLNKKECAISVLNYCVSLGFVNLLT